MELDYSFRDLEPFLDRQTLTVHYEDLYLRYLSRLNQTLTQNNFDFSYPKEELISHLEEFPIGIRDDILYNLGGVMNHEIYFDSLTPQKEVLGGTLLVDIMKKYGSVENFKKEFKDVAMGLVGSGYVNLVVGENGELNIIATSNQEVPEYYGMKTVISLDLWEHAYFLKYLTDKSKYIDLFFDFLDYSKANKRYEKIKTNSL